MLGDLWGLPLGEDRGLLGLAQLVGGIERHPAQEQSIEDDSGAPGVCQEGVVGLRLQDLGPGVSIGTAEGLAQHCLGGQPHMLGGPEGLPAGILQGHPPGEAGDGDFTLSSLSRRRLSTFKSLQWRGSTCWGQAGVAGSHGEGELRGQGGSCG